jgi:SpoVK/Ycf46/Vps4 family AAA+-type ATPase
LLLLLLVLAQGVTLGQLGALGGQGGGFGGGGGDSLNLAGLLNVLDGVVDTPGRLIIMTSNHPEKLDPALIRPGRINRKIYMGNLAVAEAVAMTKHYFGQEVTEEADLSLRKLWQDGLLSPATLESMCAEHETVQELLVALEKDLPHLHQQDLNQQQLKQEADLQMRQLGQLGSSSSSRRRLGHKGSRSLRRQGTGSEHDEDEEFDENDSELYVPSRICGLFRRRKSRV